MTEADILGLAIDRAGAINTYWNLHIAVSTAVLGIMASGKHFTSSKALKTIMTCAFVLFAYSNLDAILRLGELRIALLELLPSELSNREAFVASLAPASRGQYVAFHAVLDIAVVTAIWFVPWQLRRSPTS